MAERDIGPLTESLSGLSFGRIDGHNVLAGNHIEAQTVTYTFHSRQGEGIYSQSMFVA